MYTSRDFTALKRTYGEDLVRAISAEYAARNEGVALDPWNWTDDQIEGWLKQEGFTWNENDCAWV